MRDRQIGPRSLPIGPRESTLHSNVDLLPSNVDRFESSIQIILRPAWPIVENDSATVDIDVSVPLPTSLARIPILAIGTPRTADRGASSERYVVALDQNAR